MSEFLSEMSVHQCIHHGP